MTGSAAVGAAPAPNLSSHASEALRDAASAAAKILSESDGILVASGAGLGVDSGLPDYRGRDGFFKAYPVLVRSGILNFEAVDSPSVFETDPRLAWGFYGHRLALYRRTAPGPAFAALSRIAAALPRGLFAVTSNVDGHHQKSGTSDSRVWEIHGSVHHMQCAAKCSKAVWSADGFLPQVDEATCRLIGPLPACPHCGALARPNIQMFGDRTWVSERTVAQAEAFAPWRRSVARLAVVEIGAGLAVRAIRNISEAQAGSRLIRINPEHADSDLSGSCPVQAGASEALAAIDSALADSGLLSA